MPALVRSNVPDYMQQSTSPDNHGHLPRIGMRTHSTQAYAAYALLDRRDRLTIELALRVLDSQLKRGQANSDIPESAMHILDELRAAHGFHESNVGELQRFFTGAADIDTIAGLQGLYAAATPAPTVDLKHVAYDRIHETYLATYTDLPAEACSDTIDGHIRQIIKDSASPAMKAAANWAQIPYHPTTWMRACMEEAKRHVGDVEAIWKAGIAAAPLPPTGDAAGPATSEILERCIVACEKIRDGYTAQAGVDGPHEAADFCVDALKELRQ